MTSLPRSPLLLLMIPSLMFIGCGRSITTSNTSKAYAEPTASVAKTEETVGTPETQPEAQGPVNVVFVLDDSGSMAQRISGKSKIDIAKEVLGTLAGQIPPDVQVGLRVYGHRVKSDCKDTELLLPISAMRPDEFRQSFQNLKPLGQTPISYSLGQAAEDLKGKAGKKVIILISDGEETCAGDPCSVAAELKKADIEFRVNVVGFNIDTAAANKQLSCIAQTSGGLYFDAKNADQLLASLKSMVKASAEGGRLVSKVHDSEGKEVSTYLVIYRAGEQEIFQDITDSSVPVSLPPGKYDLKYWGKSLPKDIFRRDVEIQKGRDTIIEIGGNGRLVTSSRDSMDNQLFWYVDLYTPGGNELVLNGLRSGQPNDVPPGKYDLKFWSGSLPTVWKRDVEIKPGQETRVDVDDFGRLRVSVRNQSGNEVNMYVEVRRSGEEGPYLVSFLSDKHTQELPPGRYDLRFWQLDVSDVLRRGVEIRSSQETSVEATASK
jgi:Mg-chelatase subunit ChlD